MPGLSRKLQTVGAHVGTAVALLAAPWGTAVTLVLGILGSIWVAGSEWAQQPHIRLAAAIFLFLLWTYIGLRVVWSFNKTVRVSVVPDYRYCINPENFQIALNPASPDAALQVAFGFRNASSRPIRFRVDDFRLIIGDRTCAEPEKRHELIVPAIAVRGIRSGVFKRDLLLEARDNTGTLDVTILYGPAEGPFVRKYRFRAKLFFAFPRDSEGNVAAAAMGDELIEEKDEPINTP